MALLHPVRGRGRRGLSGALLLWLGACAGEEVNLYPPDPLLQEALGLTLEDVVRRVVLSHHEGQELVIPAQITVEPNAYVEFLSADGWVRTVAFQLDRMPSANADFLRTTGQVGSPPLLERESRFLVSFAEAPEGEYPFLVEGSVREGSGVVRVKQREPRGFFSRFR